VTFTGAALVRRRALMHAVQTYGVALDTPLLGLADVCVAGGAELWPYPEVVVQLPEGIRLDVRGGTRSRLAAYDGAPDMDHSYMHAAGYGFAGMARSLSGRRQRALALVDMGLTPLVNAASLAVRSARIVRNRMAATGAGARVRRLLER
jgi:hypothetical protein